MAGNKNFQKTANRALVLEQLRLNDGISRIDIARQLGLNRSTITNIIASLQEEGIITILSEGNPAVKGGRRPVLLGLEPGFGCVLGLEIQRYAYRAIVLDIGGTQLASRTGRINGDRRDFIELFHEVFADLQGDVAASGAPLLGIGLGIPGHVNPDRGLIISSKPLGVSNLKFDQNRVNPPDLPVLIDNDANCCAWGALAIHKSLELKHFLYLIMERHAKSARELPDQEVGVGVVVNGQVYYGADYAAGELAESLFAPDDPLYGRVFDTSGGAFDETVFSCYLQTLRNRMKLLFSVFNPSHLFFGGEFARHPALVRAAFQSLPGVMAADRICFSEHGRYEIAYGAASMFLEKLFMPPDLKMKRGLGALTWDMIFKTRAGKAISAKVSK